MRRLKSPVAHPNAATHCSAGFYASAARLPPGPLFLFITIPYTPPLVISNDSSPRTRSAISQTHPSLKTALSRPPRLLPNTLHPRSHPLFPLSPHRKLAPGISPMRSGATILHPPRLLPDARSLTHLASGPRSHFEPLILRKIVQTQNHIPFPDKNRKNPLAN